MAYRLTEFIFVCNDYIVATIFAPNDQAAWNTFFQYHPDYGNRKVACYRYSSKLYPSGLR